MSLLRDLDPTAEFIHFHRVDLKRPGYLARHALLWQGPSRFNQENGAGRTGQLHHSSVAQTGED